jgi:hypothetical protein
MNRIFVKPNGRKVRDEISLRHLADAGDFVPESTYWLRRLADGDVVLADPPAPADESLEQASPAAGE